MKTVYSPILKGSDAPELTAALGDMMFAWQHAEQVQIDCFSNILVAEYYKASRLYQKLPNFRSRTQALLTLIELHPGFEDLRPHILKLSKLSKTRNGWVHGIMIKEWSSSEIRAIDLDEPLESPKRSKPLKAADVHNHANAVRGAADQLSKALCQLPAYKAAQEALVLERLKALGRLDALQANPTPDPKTGGA